MKEKQIAMEIAALNEQKIMGFVNSVIGGATDTASIMRGRVERVRAEAQHVQDEKDRTEGYIFTVTLWLLLSGFGRRGEEAESKGKSRPGERRFRNALVSR